MAKGTKLNYFVPFRVRRKLAVGNNMEPVHVRRFLWNQKPDQLLVSQVWIRITKTDPYHQFWCPNQKNTEKCSVVV
jgi:hypothetical protein